jgi:ATP synthase protein I
VTKIMPVDETDDLQDADTFKTLTAQEVQQLRKKMPLLSVWRVVGVQILVGAVAALLAMWITGRSVVAMSVGYGALAVIIPAALFARGMTSPAASMNVGAAVFGFLLWEIVKIGLTLAMLLLAPRVVSEVSWPAMLVGLVLTMKVYWVALGVRSVFYPKVNFNTEQTNVS